MNPGDCYDRVRYSLSDEGGVLRFKAFDIVDTPDCRHIVDMLREHLVGRPLSEVDLDYLRELTCEGNGACMRTAIRVVEESQHLFARQRNDG